MSGGDYIDQAEPLFLDAYYYSFEPTGCEPVDRILEAVARAGKAYHHTESWNDPWDDDGPTEQSKIQAAANRAAELLRPVGSRNDAEQVLVALRQRVAELEQDRADLIKVARVGRGTERYIRFTPDYGSERVRRLAAEVWRIDLDRPWHTCHPDWPGSNGCTADECGRAVASSLPSPGGET